MQSLRENNSRILRIKNEKLSEYYFYMNKKIQGVFQICISVPLKAACLCETDLVIEVCSFMTATTTAENFGQFKIRFSLIVEQVLAFDKSPIIVGEVKSLSSNFKQIV